jgi:DNA-binding transcriptional MerR regulator
MMRGVAESNGSRGSPNQLTIEQLAAQSGMTVRNIRSHQARGLLAPPEVRVRVGYYGPDHLAQLRMIRDLQDQGFNLGGIKRLLDDSEETAARLRRFKAALTHLGDEPPERLTIAELGRRFRVDANQAPAVLARAERLGVLVPAGEGAYEVPSPSLLAVAEEVAGRGVPLEALFDVFEQLEEHCDAVARAFVALFVAQVWRPFQAAGLPAERWPELDEALQRLLPLASDALMAIFGRRMRTQVEAASEEISPGGERS